jgi:uncharacterized hydrophobic protein (TIGR00271 family)
MLQIRVYVPHDRLEHVEGMLVEVDGVERIVRVGTTHDGAVMLTADVEHSFADACFTMLAEHLPEADIALIRLDGVQVSDTRPQRGWLASDPDSLAWSEVIAEARTSSRLLGRYLALMAVAGVVAGIGVIEASGILIVGAMAISPDLLPLAAACVGLQQRRPRLFLRSISTLVVGLGVGTITAGSSAAILRGVGDYSGTLQLASLSSLTHTDATTIMVALAAGVAALLTYETKAGAAVGVAISVTTIPASAYLGVLLFTKNNSGAGGALGVLTTNLLCLLIGGTFTIVVQQAIRRRRSRRPASTPPPLR